MTTRKFLTLVIVAAGLLAAQATRVLVNQQLQVIGAQPGWPIVVAADGSSLVAVAPTVAPHWVLGSPSSPGCVKQADGSFLFPNPPLSIAVYRNGVRASLPGEYTITGSTLTLTSPITGEVVLCDYTY